MRGSKYIVVSLIAVVAVLAVIAFQTEEKRIRNIIYASRDAVVNRDVDMLMEYISFNYHTDRGGSYLQLRKRAEQLFKTYHDLELDVDILGVDVEGEKGEANLKVRLIASKGEDRGYLIGDVVDPEDIRVSLEKSPYKWKISGVKTRFNNSY